MYEARAKYMVETSQGLTNTYNALKDRECDDERVLELRHLHEAIDSAVLEAYSWSDLEVPPFCPTNAEEESALEAFSDEVIDHLYVLNAERATEEKRQGLNKKPAKKRPAKKTASKNSKTGTGTTMSLPGMSDSESAS